MSAAGRLRFVTAVLMVVTAVCFFGSERFALAPRRQSVLEATRLSHLAGVTPPSGSGTSKRLAKAVAQLAPEATEGLDDDDADKLGEKLDKAIENAFDDVEDLEEDLEKREDDLGDDLENTDARRAAYNKLRELNKALRPLRELLSEIRSESEVGEKPDAVLAKVSRFAAGVRAIESGIDELDVLVKDAEKHKDKDDD